jgi:hypothetical protein
MNYTDIIKLLDAGYTREQILEMKDEPADPKPDTQEEKQEDKKEPDTHDIMESVMTEVKDMFSEMKKELTAMNILNSRQEGDELKSSEDILASIINPTKKKE